MKKILNDFLHLIYPEVCIGCGSDAITFRNFLCINCFENLPKTNFFKHSNNPIEEKFFGRTKISHAASAFFFEKNTVIQRLLQELKYKQNKDCGNFMGKLMCNEMEDCSWVSEINLIVPIPLSKKRKSFRGYNQSVVIAEPIAEKYHLEINDEAIVRTVHTETQTHKNREERWNSMQEIFKINNKEIFENKHVLVLDDVITTGATTEVLCNVLLQQTNAKVSVATFACTV